MRNGSGALHIQRPRQLGQNAHCPTGNRGSPGRTPPPGTALPPSPAVLLTSGLVVVDVDTLELQVAVAVVSAGGVDAMLVGDHLPELRRKNRDINTREAPVESNMASASPARPPPPQSQPHLSADLIAALASLQMHDLSHDGGCKSLLSSKLPPVISSAAQEY